MRFNSIQEVVNEIRNSGYCTISITEYGNYAVLSCDLVHQKTILLSIKSALDACNKRTGLDSALFLYNATVTLYTASSEDGVFSAKSTPLIDFLQEYLCTEIQEIIKSIEDKA